jgi:DNA mismatch endonuclease (patch repair protein)
VVASQARRNVARDRRNDSALATAGWRVLRLWAHEPLDALILTVERALSEPRD